MKPVLVLNVVGLTMRQIGPRTPHLQALAERGAAAPMTTVLPAVTLSAQATMLTGTPPAVHGAIGNGWHFRELGETWFWRQPNTLVEGEKFYEAARARDASFTCAKLFWWWNLGARVDWSITPRPHYGADGSKYFDVYANPDAWCRRMEAELGPFPFFGFWGPKAGLSSSRWIADATLLTLERQKPTLTLAYLPHLDYDHQRYGPRDERSRRALEEVDALVGELVAAADAIGAETVVVSEYGIQAVDRPVALNRVLREAGLLAVRTGPVGETIDPFASEAFAVCDHQVAQVYVREPERIPEVRALLESVAGVERVLDEDGRRALGIDHPRAGELTAVAERGAWFTYYYWTDPAAAPDFAPTVDIHRKPGYDPCELFVDPALKFPLLRIVRRLAQKKLGLRYLMDVIPTEPSLVGGSHGRLPDDPTDGPVFLSTASWNACGGEPEGALAMTSVKERLLALLERRKAAH